MTIKIPLKKKVLSNENQTLPEKSPSKGRKGSGAEPPCPIVSAPFIDRISIVLTVPTPEEAHEIHEGILNQLTPSESFQSAPGGTWDQYKVARRVVIESVANSKKWPLLQYAYDKQKKAALEFRTEFSPVDLGEKGIYQFHLKLTSLMPDGWEYLLKHGRVTMLEVTVDVMNVGIEDFHILPSQGPSVTTWRRNGTLETLVLGKPKGNQTKIYNRGQKRIAKKHGKKQGWKGPITTRIERRLKFGDPPNLSMLANLENPFDVIKMVFTTPGPPPGEPKMYLWVMFMDSVRIRTLPAALKLLPAEKRTLYRKWFAQHEVSWWDPAKIWEEWSETVKKSKLTDKF